ncbi:MAG TPA: glycine--tRNA ligase subunit beta [Drouetiella sp.]
MPTYLLEIGTEELPAGFIPEAQSKLEQLLADGLKGKNLSYKSMKTMSTPRRLTVIVNDLAATQETTTSELKGPPADKCFNEHGNLTDTGTGFLKKNNLTLEQLEKREVKGVTYVFAQVTTQGKPAAEVLSEILPKIIPQLSGERPMRWGSYEMKFSRPIRWIVSLLDDKVVEFKVENLTAGRHSMGHRILSPGKVEIQNTKDYVDALKKANVLIEPSARQEVIEHQVKELAERAGGKAKQLGGSLLEEVVHITEWPKAVLGDFDKEFLDLPDALIETIMVHHQRYFPVEKKQADSNGNNKSVLKKSLLPHFITIANNDVPDAQPEIKQGNERVLRARLADGRFFYFDDQKTKLSARVDALANLTFQEGLGSYKIKIDRLTKLAELLIKDAHVEPKHAEPLYKVLELCKLDLVTNLVRELPELQGHVGSWYAEQEGQPPEVVHAVASHYAPRSADDEIPADTIGQLASVLDKVDNLVGLFALGRRPSGSSDPYGFRRQAQGIIDVLIDGLKDHAINLANLIKAEVEWFGQHTALKTSKKGYDAEKITAELNEFLMQRLRFKLQDMGFGREVIESVLSAREPFWNLPNVVTRCRATEALLKSEDGVDTARAGLRVRKILGDTIVDGELDTALLKLEPEKELVGAYDSFDNNFMKPRMQQHKTFHTVEDYSLLQKELSKFSKPVHAFFDGVMVNDKDEKIRKNRHALLRKLDVHYKLIADFSKLQSLIP